MRSAFRWAGAAAGALLAGLTLMGAGPAGADTASGTTPAAAITFTSPATDGATMTSPATLSGTVQVTSGVIDSIDITVRWTDTASRPPAAHPTQETTITPPQGPNASWSFTPQPAANGRYTVTVVATTTQSGATVSDQTTASRSFVLDVPPATPTGVKATADAAQRTAHITWAPNTEPDLVGYEVVRAGPGPTDTGKVLAGVVAPQTDYTDTQVATEPAGTYRYTVAAVRQSGDGSKADFSGQSAEASVAFTTPPKAQAPPPPTTQAPSKPGSSQAGGSNHPGTTAGAAPLVLPAAGHVPLSEYQRLVNQAQASTVTTEPPDPGFNNKLPYQPQVTHQVVQMPGAALESGTLGAADQSQGIRRTAEFVAGALMLAVLALFGFVLTRAADRGESLETIAPGPEVTVPAVPAPVGPSLMLTIVRPPTPDPTPVER